MGDSNVIDLKLSIREICQGVRVIDYYFVQLSAFINDDRKKLLAKMTYEDAHVTTI